MKARKVVLRFGPTKRSVLLVVLVFFLAPVSFATSPPCSASPYDCAVKFIQESHFKLAADTLEAVLRQTPDDPRVLNLMGIALTNLGRTEDANRAYKRAFHIDPQFYPALNNLAVNEFHSKHLEQARIHFEAVLKLAPNDASANLFMGEILFGEEKYSAAVSHYQKAGELFSKYPLAVLHNAESQLRNGNGKAALSVLKWLPKSDAKAHFSAGKLLVQHHLYADAANEFGIARRTGKDPYLAGYNQAVACVRAGEYVKAIHTGNELLNEGYETAELAGIVGTAYLRNGQTKEAYNAFRIATHLNPKDEDSYIRLSEICLNWKKYDVGLQIIDIGLSHLPDSESLYLERGVLRAMKGQFKQAHNDFAAAAKVAPDDVLPHVALGLVAMQQGNSDEAVAVFRQSVKRHPDNYLAQYWYSKALTSAGVMPGTKQAQEVIAALKTSVQLNPDYWHSRSDLGKALLDNGETDSAIVQLKKAAKLNPKATAPLYLLARAYRKKGQTVLARELDARVGKIQAKERGAMSQSFLKNALREGVSQSMATGQTH